jgi:[ribosomal protein S18]-alanine N-acetyltransferase
MSAQIDNLIRCVPMDDSHLGQVIAIEEAVHACPWTRGNFAESIAAGYDCWMAYRGTTLVGYGVLASAAGEAHVLNVSVAREWQRCGVGTELTRFFIDVARERGASKIFLEVRPSNLAARALYAREGFTEIATRRDYYPAPMGREDAIVMERAL